VPAAARNHTLISSTAAPSRAEVGGRKMSDKLRQRMEEEVGDLFFVLVNIARYLSLDPESALKKTNRKFKRSFQPSIVRDL